jgi:hypothetical protein
VFLRARSAVKQGQRPTAAILCEPNPHDGWTRLDYMLQDACLVLEAEVCGTCHNPVWLCHSTDNRIDFKIAKRTCYAKAEIEDYEKTPEGRDLGSGEYLLAKPIGIEGKPGEYEPLPTRQDAYKSMQTD